MISSLLAIAILSYGVVAKQLACNDKISFPEYFGTKVTSMKVEEVKNWEDWSPIADFLQVPFERRPISFCNVTLAYTHPGQGDSVNVYLWLPLKGWNGNLLAMGGGGFAAGGEGNLAPAVARNYAAVMTDAGHTFHTSWFDAGVSARTWALTSPGNVNWQLLQNFAAVSLNDMTHLGKSVIESFYTQKPKFSYWVGCSTGGRQGLMQAQRYATNYDGILANAPAINWATFVPGEQWPQVLMKREGYWPPACEVEAITKAAVEACDELDGVKYACYYPPQGRDNIVAAPGLCGFNAESTIGNSFDCGGEKRKISAAAARIVNGAWKGIAGKIAWPGLNYDTMLSTSRTDLPMGGLAQTTCDKNNNNCKGSPMPISESWIKHFLAKSPEYDLDEMSEEDFFRFLHQCRQEYTSIIDTADPDLADFRAAGGKMITWHGLADQLIFPNGSSNYYQRVLEQDSNAADFYRYFEAPGVAHCGNGPGAIPWRAFDALIDWVENGHAPEQLDASTMSFGDEKVVSRPICLWPKVAAYQGGDPDVAASFECAATFGSKKASDHKTHSEL